MPESSSLQTASLPPGEFGAFLYAGKAVLPDATTLVKNLRVDTLAVVSHPHPDLPFVVMYLHFDPASPCVQEGIAQRFGGKPIYFRQEDRNEVPASTFYLHPKLGVVWAGLIGQEPLTEWGDCTRQVVHRHRRRTQHRWLSLAKRA